MDNPIPGNSFPELPADPPDRNRFNLHPKGENPQNPPEKKKGFIWPILSLIGLVLLKFKNLFIFLKFAKFGITAIS
ncbi:MAG TPA: hypothetical protein VN944_01345, partial [Nitrospiria bacterium]|nr:hypothetical protein [Nitrospiria bacterium]